ncbi:MAG: cytochrome c oxidase subunit II [Arenimonas sp.]|nr:cytochrome c oxidase subunit II [Arenimonas sp.]
MKFPRITQIMALLMSMMAASAVFAQANTTDPVRWQLNMTQGVTTTAANAYNSHMIMLWICVIIGIIVFGAMAYAMIKFRHSKGAVADTNFVHSTKLELIWTILPILILIGSAYPATRMVMAQYGANYGAAKDEMVIKVTGYQWMWRYEYVGEGVDFISRLDRKSDDLRQNNASTQSELAEHTSYLRDVDKPLVIPADTRIRFVITSDDVIHSWWVPALGWKQDAIPGTVNDAWTKVAIPGTYRGVCAELCGKDHGFMPIVVKVLPKAEYQVWLAAQKQAPVIEAAPVAAPAEATVAPEAVTEAPTATPEVAPAT